MVKENDKEKMKTKIMVIGDVMLDTYVEGKVERISPEAPIPILEVKDIYHSLGGAANVAKNLCSFDINTYLIGYVGNDSNGEIFKKLIEEDKINNKLFQTNVTTSKRRYGWPQMLRVDKEERVRQEESDLIKIIEYIDDINPSSVIVSDYAKGCITQPLYNALIKKSIKAGYDLIVDPKPKNNIDYKGCSLITPNIKEAIELSGEDDIKDIGKNLSKKYNCNVLITRGKDGMDLFYGAMHDHVPSIAKDIYNVSGAGDAVIASMAYSLSMGLSLPEAMDFSNKVAGDIVLVKSTSIEKKYDI